MINAAAISPATKIDPRRKSVNSGGPANVPKAPASFQSPAPRLRSNTNGSNKPSPSNAPSREVFSPPQPPTTLRIATPAANPETVSQFGMRRLRRSVHPAIAANNTAPAKIGGLKRTSNQEPDRVVHFDLDAETEKRPFCICRKPLRASWSLKESETYVTCMFSLKLLGRQRREREQSPAQLRRCPPERPCIHSPAEGSPVRLTNAGCSLAFPASNTSTSPKREKSTTEHHLAAIRAPCLSRADFHIAPERSQ